MGCYQVAALSRSSLPNGPEVAAFWREVLRDTNLAPKQEQQLVQLKCEAVGDGEYGALICCQEPGKTAWHNRLCDERRSCEPGADPQST